MVLTCLQSAVFTDFACPAATRYPIHVRGFRLNYVQRQLYSDVTVQEVECDRRTLCHGEWLALRRVLVRSSGSQLHLSAALTYSGVTSNASRVHWLGVSVSTVVLEWVCNWAVVNLFITFHIQQFMTFRAFLI